MPADLAILRAYCRGLRAGRHDANAVLVQLEAIRVECLCDHAIEQLGATARLRWLTRERRVLSWERRLVNAERLRLVLVRWCRRQEELTHEL